MISALAKLRQPPLLVRLLRMAGLVTALLDPARICLRLQGVRRTAALHEVAQLLNGHPDVTGFDGFYAELLARDRLDTTCLGNEVALPHARTEHVRKLALAVGRSDTGVRFESSNQTVRLLFVIGTPKSAPGDYLALVSTLCKILRSDTTRAALLTAGTPEEFIVSMAKAESELGR
jgi:mannitol/fructose-specific phosphotransferase system IIA component (Ntr-type)